MSGGRSYAARRRAFDLAEVAARVRSQDDLEGYANIEDDVEALLDLVVAQARLSAMLARWVARRLPASDVADVLRILRVETEVSAASGDLAALDQEFPFDA